MTCNRCGKEIYVVKRFCPNCGAPVNNQEQMQQPNNSTSNFAYNPSDHTYEFSQSDIIKNIGISVFSYLGILFIIPFISNPKSKFVRFHVNQGIILFIFYMIFNVIIMIAAITIFSLNCHMHNNYNLAQVLYWVEVVCLILQGIVISFRILGIINVLRGKAKELPLIGKFRIIKY